MKMLITGGAGFIGTNFVYQRLKERGKDEYVVLDLLTYAGKEENLEAAKAHGNFKFVKGDIADQGAVFDLFAQEKFDVVVNFAAESHVDRSIENPTIFTVSNVIGTQTLMDAGRKHGIRRFHQVSTDEVYGDLPLDRPDLKFTEEWPIRPSSPYAASKAAADLMVLAYHRTFKLPVTISRCSNNYGPYQYPEKLIPLMIDAARRGKPLPVYGNGLNVRDWIHVEDHCHAITTIIDQGRDGQVYNIGGGNELTNIDIIGRIKDKVGNPKATLEYVKDRPGHDLRYAIDSTKAQNELRWRPQVDFDEGLRRTIEWYLK
jgi:dTDP-glucose 4,6-dehydratase